MASSTGGVYGIKLGIIQSAATPWQRAHIARAVTSTGLPSSGSTMWFKLAVIDQQATPTTGNNNMEDVTPNDAIVRHYRVKGVYTGYTDSTWSAPVSASPTQLS